MNVKKYPSIMIYSTSTGTGQKAKQKILVYPAQYTK
jgi:hypothetical protein